MTEQRIILSDWMSVKLWAEKLLKVKEQEKK